MSSVVLTEIEFATLVGKPENSDEVRQFLASVDEPARIGNYEGERRYLSFLGHGFDIVLDEGLVTGCHLLNRVIEPGWQLYSGVLPHGLTFTDSRDAVIQKLGTPARTHAGRDDPRPFVRMKPWVKYEYPSHSLHVEFSPDASHVELITLLAPEQRRN